MTNLPIGQRFTINGVEYALRKAEPPTPEELAAIKAKQDACPHDRGVYYTDPLTCMACGKVPS